MTAWIYLGLVLASCVGMVATYFKGAQDAEQRITAQQLSIELVAERAASQAREGMLNAVVQAVESIEIEQRTFVRNFKTIEKENVVYRECKHSDDAVRLLNAALRGDTVPGQPAVQVNVPGESR